MGWTSGVRRVAFLSLIASLELRPCFPLRNFWALRDIVADHEQEPRIFYGALETPVTPNRVGHFVVALRNILVNPVAGVALRLADIVSAALDVNHRHPCFREFKMIRPIERTEFGPRFGAHGASLHRRKFLYDIVHARLTEADDFHIFGASPCVYPIDIDVGQRSMQRVERMRSEEHTSELQSPDHLVCRLLLEKKKKDACLYQP